MHEPNLIHSPFTVVKHAASGGWGEGGTGKNDQVAWRLDSDSEVQA